MSSTKFGIVASTANAIISRFIYPNTNAELLSVPLKQGETMIQVNNGPFPNSAAWQTAVNNAVQTALGKPPGNPRCCVIDGLGNVVNVFMGDATLDAPAFPGMTLINSASAGAGWTWTAQDGFVAPPVSQSKSAHK